MNISLIVLRARNIDETRGFYELLGLNFVREKHGGGPEHFSTTIGSCVLEIYPTREGQDPDNIRIGFELENLNEVIERFSERSGWSLHPRKGTRILVARDPDGRSVEVERPRV